MIFLLIFACNGHDTPVIEEVALAEKMQEIQSDKIGLGPKIDSLHNELVKNEIAGFDYSATFLTFDHFEESNFLSLSLDNDVFGLVSALPTDVLKRSHWIYLVGYFYTDDKYYVILNCWDKNSLYPIGYLVEIDTSYKMQAKQVYAFDLDVADDFQILKYSYFDPVKNGLTTFDVVYTGAVSYGQDPQIQKILPSLTDDETRRYKGQGYTVTVEKEDGSSVQWKDVAWYKSSRVPASTCFPEEVIDYIYLRSENWYSTNIGGVPDSWKFELKKCE